MNMKINFTLFLISLLHNNSERIQKSNLWKNKIPYYFESQAILDSDILGINFVLQNNR